MMFWKADVEAASKMIGKRNGRMRDFIFIYCCILSFLASGRVS